MERLLARINKLIDWQAALIIGVLGLIVYFSGLNNPFQGDDMPQIVNNPVIHSIANLTLLFKGGTFYFGHGLAPLGGQYYRPLMMVAFSLLYAVFGPHPLGFHLFQLGICTASAFLLYLVLKLSFKPALALVLAIIFLVHPLDSQTIFAIPSLQDALFFFFGILAVWLLIRFISVRSLFLVTACLFLSLLSKESGVLFIAIAMLYLWWFDRKRLLPFIGIMVLPVVLYLVLNVHAVGWHKYLVSAPIDQLNLTGRLMTIPAIIFFYMTKLVFPLSLATGYDWIHPTFSVRYVLIPLVADFAAIGSVIYLAFAIRRKVSAAMWYTYLFFLSWTAFGLLAHVQLIPLDLTVCEDWFYFSMAGVLGMIGVVVTAYQARIKPTRLYIITGVIIVVLGTRTAIRGLDYKSVYTLAMRTVVISKEDYTAYNQLGAYYFDRQQYHEASTYYARSVAAFPNALSYGWLGQSYALLGNYPAAYAAYTSGLKYQNYAPIYDGLAALTSVYGDSSANKRFLIRATEEFPQDPTIWTSLALLEYRQNEVSDAKVAVAHAYEYGSSSQTVVTVYNRIMNGLPPNVTSNLKSTN